MKPIGQWLFYDPMEEDRPADLIQIRVLERDPVTAKKAYADVWINRDCIALKGVGDFAIEECRVAIKRRFEALDR